VLASEAMARLLVGVLTEAAALLDLGLHRLRDLSRPQQIFQYGGDHRPSGEHSEE
jgi:class 3 adenylate cyclase